MPSVCFKTSFILTSAEVISVDTIQETPAPGQLWEYRALCWLHPERSNSLNRPVSVLKKTRRGQVCSSSALPQQQGEGLSINTLFRYSICGSDSRA